MRLASRKCQTVIHNARALRRWLNSHHEYGDEEGSITLTGWQYLDMGALTIVAMLLLSIRI